MLTPTLHAMVPMPDELAAARAWLTERKWVDADAELIADLTPLIVFRAIDAHYDGGWARFVMETRNADALLREGWFV